MKTEIISGLWISSINEIKKSKFLINKNLDFVVNCTSLNIDNYISIIEEQHEKSIRYINIPIRDIPADVKKNSILLVDNMNDITNMIHKYIANNKNVIIVCDTGLHASLTISICYLIRFGKINLEYASIAIRSKNNLLDIKKNLYTYTINQYNIELKQQ
jgi:protein-tyrosine phosphatase